MDLLGVLCVLGVILAVVTVVGHCIWLVLAALVRAISTEPTIHADPKTCRACGHPQGVVGERCVFCGEAASTTPNLKSDLHATTRLLGHLHGRGVIDNDVYATIIRVVREEQGRLEGRVPLVATPPGATKPPVVEIEFIDKPVAASSPPIEAELSEVASAAAFTRAVPPLQIAPATAPRVALNVPDRGGVRPVVKPARTLADVLKAFMEEKNIRWGELISGLLIVLCAVGLVISLRTTLQETVPYFPGLLFMLVTAAIHGAGNYTLRRWHLTATSRGVLIIGTLLVPLNFLAAIILSGPEEKQIAVGDPMFIVAVLVGLSSYGAMTWFASRALQRVGWGWLMLAVMGPSVGQLLINRLVSPDMSAWRVTALMMVPTFSYLVAMLAQLARTQQTKELTPRRAEQLLLFLGLATFSLLAPLALLISKVHVPGESWLRASADTLAQLSPLLSLAAAVIVGAGLLVQSRARHKRLATIRTTGTALALCGAALMAMLVALAWPNPELLIAVGLVNGAALVTLAVLCNLPALHWGAVACGGLAYLVGFHWWQGSLDGYDDNLGPRLVQLLVLGKSCVALTIYAAALGAVGVLLRRSNSARFAPKHGLEILFSAGGVATLAIATTLVVAFWPLANWPDREPSLATPLLYVYAVALLGAAIFTRQPLATWGGSLLLWSAFVHTLDGNVWMHDALAYLGLVPDRPVLDATVMHAVVGMALALGVALRQPSDESAWKGLVVPLGLAALLSSLAGTPFVFLVKGQDYALSAGHGVAIAGVWLVAAWLHRLPALATAFQAMAAAALDLAVLAIGLRGGWWDGTPFDLQFLPVHFVALAAWCCLWSGARQIWAQRPRDDNGRLTPLARLSAGLAELFDTPWPAVDQVLLAVLVRASVLLTAFGCWPGIVEELGMESQVSQWSGRRAHELAYAGAVWIALGAVFCALLAALWERLSRRGLAGLFVAASAIPFLLSGPFEAEHAVASALRWSFALYGVLAAAAICSRTPLANLARRFHWRGTERFAEHDQPRLRILALALGGLPVLLLTTWTFVRVASGESLGGPDDDSLFDLMGPSLSYSLPLLLCTGTLVAFALREGSPGYALGGSLLFQATITLGYVLRGILAGETPDAAYVVELVQWNALGLAGYSLGWLALRTVIERHASSAPARSVVEEFPLRALHVQLTVLLVVLAGLSIWAGLIVVFWPGEASPAAVQLGSWPSYVAFFGGLAALGWRFRDEWRLLGVHALFGAAMALATLVAASIHAWDVNRTWLSLHALDAIWLAAALAATSAVVALRTSPTTSPERWHYVADLAAWATMLGAAVVVLATRGLWGDPLEWWSALMAAAVAGVALALSLAGRSQPYALAATICAALAATNLWLGVSSLPHTWDTLVYWNLLAVLFPAAAVLAAEISCQRRFGASFDVRFGAAAVQHGVAIGVLAILLAMVAGGMALTSLIRAAGGSPFDSSTLESLLVLAGLLALLFAMLWDRTARFAVPMLYLWGLGFVAFLLDQWEDAPLFGPLVARPELRPSFTLLAVGLSAVLYAALTGRIWLSGLYLARWGSRRGVPQTVSSLARITHWLPAATFILSGLAVVIELGVVLTFEERWMRILAGFAPAIAAIGIGALAQERRQNAMQLASLLFAGGSAVLLGWANMPPEWRETVVLERAIWLLIAMALLTFLLGAVVVRLDWVTDEWKVSAQRAGGIYGALALAALLLTLSLEATFFVPGVGAPLTVPQVGAVVVVLTGLIVGLLSLALLPQRDPLALSEEGRMYYVYGAQGVGALLFAHLYLSNPMLFDAGLRAYWPYIVVGISFFGVGAAEIFERAGWRVLAEPFRRTGAFLPLLPVIGIWIFAAEHTNYSLLLFVVGLLYALLAMHRKSMASALAAAVAGNAALWALLSDQQFSILANPQIWAIPPALSVVVAAHLNRQRLGEESLTSVRYAAMLVIYASSTAEIFIHSAETSLWPPMILAALSVCGVFAGIGLQIRAFLYLGSSFLALSILSMVWNAARNIGHIWPWFVFGIGLGLAILILFGIFEKKRKEIGLLIERMRQWER